MPKKSFVQLSELELDQVSGARTTWAGAIGAGAAGLGAYYTTTALGMDPAGAAMISASAGYLGGSAGDSFAKSTGGS